MNKTFYSISRSRISKCGGTARRGSKPETPSLRNLSCHTASSSSQPQPDPTTEFPTDRPRVFRPDYFALDPGSRGYQHAVIAAGCFWGVEEVFLEVDGIVDCVSGYSGGSVEYPTYKRVLTGSTGHAEAVLLTFNPKKVAYRRILDIMFAKFDMTTLNRQGNDRGPQYRSAIFFVDETQRQEAERKIHDFNASQRGIWPFSRVASDTRQAVVEVVPFKEFWTAEMVHQRYYTKDRRAEEQEAEFDHFLWATGIDKLDV